MDDGKYNAVVSGFELSVVTPKAVVESNVDELVTFITERMKDYSPDKYAGDSDSAKKDRTELNKGIDQVKAVRQSIQALNPYGSVIEKLSNAEKLIKSGSDALGEIVRAKENEEKEAKRKLIELEWNSRKFDLFALEKVFNPKWLNKTYKLTDITNEISVLIEKTYSDLKTIESIDKFSEDAETLKAYYLNSLDVSDTIKYGDQLIEKRELLKKEAEERAAREHEKKIAEQRVEVRKDNESIAKRSSIMSLVEQAQESKIEEHCGNYVLTVCVSDTQLVGLKSFLTCHGIEYECRELEF